MSLIVDELENEYGDRIAFRRLNADEEDGKAVAQTYRVRGHPALVVLDDRGNVVWSRVGVQSRDDVARALENVLVGEDNR